MVSVKGNCVSVTDTIFLSTWQLFSYIASDILYTNYDSIKKGLFFGKRSVLP